MLGDCGLATPLKTENQELTHAGTRQFIAPEAFKGETVADADKVDIWAAGCVMYELLHGKLPFGAAHKLQVSEAVINFDPIYPDLPANATVAEKFADKICRSCLSKV